MILGNILGTKDIADQISNLSKGLGIETKQVKENTAAKMQNIKTTLANIFAKQTETAVSKELTTQELVEAVVTDNLSAKEAKLKLLKAGVINTNMAENVTIDEVTRSKIAEAIGTERLAAAEAKLAGTKNASLGSKALSLLTNPTTWVVLGIIAAGIVAIKVAYDNSVKGMIKANQKLIDSNKEVRDSLTEEINTNDSNASNLQSLYEDYLTAKKGSEEYYNAVNAIAELSSDLVVGYDDQGNDILANN